MDIDYQVSLREKAHALARIDSSKGFLQFLDHIVVDAQPIKQPFRTIAEDWQWDRVMRSKDALEYLAGISPPGSYRGVSSFWNEYHKGSDKTHDTAREILWLLAFSRRRLTMYVCAGSQDQASLITTAMRGTIQDNPWLKDYTSVTELTARGASGSELTIMPLNAWGGQGIFPDYVLAEEITHWQYEEGRKFWDFILSSVNKRPSCVLKVNTNAGHKGSWQWLERERIRTSPYWKFYSAPVGLPLPRWMNQAKIDDDSRGMLPGERDRLYKNRWVDPGEENGYLSYEEAQACVDLNLFERPLGDRNIEYVAAVDYGGVTDRCALTVLHVEPGTDRVVVDRLDCWQGSHSSRIAVNKTDDGTQSVEGWIENTLRSFRIGMLVLDPAQLEGLAISFERKGVNVKRFEYKGGRSNHKMAQLLRICVQNRKITWSPQAGILPMRTPSGLLIEDRTFSQELAGLVIKPMSYGYRFDHESGRHDDRSCCVAMALVYALPEALPAGSLGPKVISALDKPAIRSLPIPEKDYTSQWNIMGMEKYRR